MKNSLYLARNIYVLEPQIDMIVELRLVLAANMRNVEFKQRVVGNGSPS